MPTPLRIRHTLAYSLLLSLLAVLFAPHPAHAATMPVYKGTGWKAWTSNGIYSLAPDAYTIVFADATARTKLSKYFTGPAAQVTTSVGVPLTVSTTLDTTPATSCPAKGRIIVHYGYRPAGTKGMSQTRACHSLTDGSAWSAHVLMDSEYWTSATWFSSNTTLNESYRKNAVTHELGHALGLAHPNYDRDKDGTVENFECVKDSAGWTPVLCSPNGGNRTSTGSGKFISFDVAGLRQMAANYYLRQTG